MTLDRKDYKSAIPQLEKKIDSLTSDASKGLQKFDVLIDQAIAKINATKTIAVDARTSANGKNTIYYANSAPTGGEYKVDDVWFDTAHDSRINRWNGSAWVSFTLGDDAIGNLNASHINAGTIDASQITVSNLDASNLTSGTVSASRIDASTLKIGGYGLATTNDTANAEKKATDYIEASGTGIKVHKVTDANNYALIDSNGMKVYQGGSSSLVASFGTDVVLGKTNGINNVINSSGFAINDSSTNIASFKVGDVRDGGATKTATRIEATNEIGIYANGYSSTTDADKGLIIAKRGGAPVFYFGRALQFCPQPYAQATSTYSNVSIPLNTNPATSVPMTQIAHSSGHTFMDIDAGCIKFSNDYDGLLVEVTASVYVVPSTNTQATIYLYHYSDTGTTTEVAAGSTYLSSYGGAVQLVPRIISRIYMGDKLYIGVRLFSATGTAYCNHKDTFLTVKYM